MRDRGSVWQLDRHIRNGRKVSAEAAAKPDGDLDKFLREMSATETQPVPSLKVTSSTVPNDTAVVLLEQKGR